MIFLYNMSKFLLWVAATGVLMGGLYVKHNFVETLLMMTFLMGGIYTRERIDFNKLQKLWEFICEYNPTIINYYQEQEELTKLNSKQPNDKEDLKNDIKLETKYENKYHEKYLTKFKTFPNEIKLTEEEQSKINPLKMSLKLNEITRYNTELKGVTVILNEIQTIIAAGGLNTQEGIKLMLEYFNLSEYYNVYSKKTFTDYQKNDEENDEEQDDVDLEECWSDLLIDKGLNEIKLDELQQMTETYNKTDEEFDREAYETILKEHLSKYINNYVLETTPLGNVYMRYNSNKEVFEYFSDYTMPYRYLETVGRKYVMTYWCKPIFVDLDEEIKNGKELDKVKQSVSSFKPSKETLEIMNKIKAKNTKMALPTQVQANLPTIQDGNKEKQVLKERANRYTWEGRLHDFCPLKKINKKEVDKRLNLTFAEYKKMMLQNKK